MYIVSGNCDFIHVPKDMSPIVESKEEIDMQSALDKVSRFTFQIIMK